MSMPAPGHPHVQALMRVAGRVAHERRSASVFRLPEGAHHPSAEAIARVARCASYNLATLPGGFDPEDGRLVGLPDRAVLARGLVLHSLSWQLAAAHGRKLFTVLNELWQAGGPVWLFAIDGHSTWSAGDLWIPRGRAAPAGVYPEVEYVDADAVRAEEFIQEAAVWGPVFESPADLVAAESAWPTTSEEAALARALRPDGLTITFSADRWRATGAAGSTEGRFRRSRLSDRSEEGDRLVSARAIRRDAESVARAVAARVRGDTPAAPLDVPEWQPTTGPDRDQHAAIYADDGVVRLLAPAGAGKTTTLVRRSRRLRQIGHAQLLALAFNTEAAGEMRQRLARAGVDGVQSRTFNSLGLTICKEDLGFKNWDSLARSPNVRDRVGQDLCALLGEALGAPLPAGCGNDLFAAFDKAKGDLVAPGALLRAAVERAFPAGAAALPPPNAPVWQDVFDDVVKLQEREGLLTFNDQLYLAVRGIARNPELRQRLQRRWGAVLVEEFQDLNGTQLAFVDMIVAEHRSLFAVGDDDQMIYGFRGADIRVILNFPETFPGTDSKLLSTNYRCADGIVRHADRLLKNNLMRERKTIRSADRATTGRVDFRTGASLDEEIAAAVEFVLERRAGGVPEEQIAILFRYHNADLIQPAPGSRRAGVKPEKVGIVGRLKKALARAGVKVGPVKDGPDDDAGELAPPGVGGRAGRQSSEGVEKGVTLGTFHTAKGREWDSVVVLNARNQPPFRLAHVSESEWKAFYERAAVEEERRLYYVAFTRAGKALRITAPRASVTPFVTEFLRLPPESQMKDVELGRALTQGRASMARAGEEARSAAAALGLEGKIDDLTPRELATAQKLVRADDSARLGDLRARISALQAIQAPLGEPAEGCTSAWEAGAASVLTREGASAELLSLVGRLAAGAASRRNALRALEDSLAARPGQPDDCRWGEEPTARVLAQICGSAAYACADAFRDAFSRAERAGAEVRYRTEDLQRALANRTWWGRLRGRAGWPVLAERQARAELTTAVEEQVVAARAVEGVGFKFGASLDEGLSAERERLRVSEADLLSAARVVSLRVGGLVAECERVADLVEAEIRWRDRLIAACTACYEAGARVFDLELEQNYLQQT